MEEQIREYLRANGSRALLDTLEAIALAESDSLEGASDWQSQLARKHWRALAGGISRLNEERGF